jgi:hypothetical protein
MPRGGWAAVAFAVAAVSTGLPAHQAASPPAAQQGQLIAHYPLANSLFDATRTHSPLIVSGASFHTGRGIFCNGEYTPNWPEGCDVRTAFLKQLDLSSFTISAQFLVPKHQPHHRPVFVLGQSSRALSFVLHQDGRVQLLTNNNVFADCSVRYRTGFWHEAAIAFDGRMATLYLDGVAGCRAKGPLNAGNDRVVLLSNYGGAATYYGFLRDLRIHNGVVVPERTTPAADDVKAPEPVHVPPVDRFLASCPTAAQISAVNRDLRLDFDADPTSREPLVCRSSEGSRDLSPMKRRVYNMLLLMQGIEFDQPLPWTNAPLYKWLTSAIRGIRFRDDIQNPFCCNPERVINLRATPNSFADGPDRWIDPASGAAVGVFGLMPVIVHEARHAEGRPHTCGVSDRTLEELGGWGAHYYLLRWLAEHTDQAFFSSGPRNYNGRLKGQADNILKTRICGK